MKVNSGKKVARLNAGGVNGKDSGAFVTEDTHLKAQDVDGIPNGTQRARITCGDGDLAVGGGYFAFGEGHQVPEDLVATDGPFGGYLFVWSSGATAVNATVFLTCADLGKPRVAASSASDIEELLEGDGQWALSTSAVP